MYRKVIPMDMSGIGHFCSFLLFGAVACFLRPVEPLSHMLGKIILFAGGAELMQFHVDERTPQLMDFFLDVSGGVSGIILFALFFSKFKTNTSGIESL